MLFFKQLNTLPSPLFKIYSCWSVGVPGGCACLTARVWQSERVSSLSEFQGLKSAQQAWKRGPSSFEASCCPLPSAHVFSVLGLFFSFFVYSQVLHLFSRHFYTEKRGYQITSAWAVGAWVSPCSHEQWTIYAAVWGRLPFV